MSESGQPLDSFEVLLRRRMVSASDRALRPFEPSAIALKAASGSAARPAAKSAGRTAWYVLLAAALVLAALLFAAGSGAFRNLIVAPVVPLPSPHSSVAPSLAPSPAADGLILFAINHSIDDGAGGDTYCTTFHTIRPDGSGEQQLAGDCLTYGHAGWSPASWSSTGDGIIIDSAPEALSMTQVYEVTPANDPPRVLMALDGTDPAFSPDGSQMAYAGVGMTLATDGIFIAAADGTHPHQLTSLPDALLGPDEEPRFSPDGSRLVFTRHTGDSAASSEVWMVNADGSDLHQLTAALPVSYSARWSPDGSHLLFTGRQQRTKSQTADVGLWTIDADGTGLTQVMNGTGGQDDDGDWSPDGSRIVYTHFDPETRVNSLCVMNADGSGVTTLLSNNAGDNYVGPDWSRPVTP